MSMSFSRDPNALVRHFGTRDPFVIARGLGFGVHQLYHPESRLPGLTCLVANRPSIFINRAYFDQLQEEDPSYTDEMAEYDILQVAAHELGHAVRDKDQLRLAPIKEYEIFDVRIPLEAGANSFAADIRIDRDEMLDLFHSQLALLDVASRLHVNVNLLIYKIDSLRKEGYRLNQLPYIPKTNFMGNIHGSHSAEWD